MLHRQCRRKVCQAIVDVTRSDGRHLCLLDHFDPRSIAQKRTRFRRCVFRGVSSDTTVSMLLAPEKMNFVTVQRHAKRRADEGVDTNAPNLWPVSVQPEVNSQRDMLSVHTQVASVRT